jgi:hypothetical protein
MQGKLQLEKGDATKMLPLGVKAPHLAEVFASVETEWPDEMSPERVEEYRAQMNEFRAKLGI